MYIKQIANTLRTFGECFLTTHEIECEHSPIPHVHHEIGCKTLCKTPTYTYEIGCEHSVRRRGDSLCPYPNIANCTYSHYQIRVYSLSNMHIHIIKYVFSYYQIRIFVPHFVCIFLYVGTINRSPTAADGLPITWRTLCKHSTYTHEMGCEHSVNSPRPPRNWLQNIPSGVGDRFIVPYPYITKNAFPHSRICISTLSITFFHLTTHTSLHYHTNIFVFCCL